MQTLDATITYQDLEGGFWGLMADDGRQYRPVNPLPEDLQQEGRRVRVSLEPAQVFSISMWGQTVRIRDLQPL